MESDSKLPTVMITVYGKPKKKKTSDALATFPSALFLGVPSAITLVAQNELGFTPSVHPNSPKNLPDLVALLRHLATTGEAIKYGAVVVDDLTQCLSGERKHRRVEAARRIISFRTNN